MDLPFQEGDKIRGQDGREYRVSEAYPESITVVEVPGCHERIISKVSFEDYEKVEEHR